MAISSVMTSSSTISTSTTTDAMNGAISSVIQLITMQSLAFVMNRAITSSFKTAILITAITAPILSAASTPFQLMAAIGISLAPEMASITSLISNAPLGLISMATSLSLINTATQSTSDQASKAINQVMTSSLALKN